MTMYTVPVYRFRISEPEQSDMRDRDGQHCVVVADVSDEYDRKRRVMFADGFEGIAFEDELTATGIGG